MPIIIMESEIAASKVKLMVKLCFTHDIIYENTPRMLNPTTNILKTNTIHQEC